MTTLAQDSAESEGAARKAVLGRYEKGLQTDFEAAALPLEVFLRGLDGEPALQRSA